MILQLTCSETSKEQKMRQRAEVEAVEWVE